MLLTVNNTIIFIMNIERDRHAGTRYLKLHRIMIKCQPPPCCNSQNICSLQVLLNQNILKAHCLSLSFPPKTWCHRAIPGRITLLKYLFGIRSAMVNMSCQEGLRRNQFWWKTGTTERYPTVPGPVSPLVPAGDEKKLETSGTNPEKNGFMSFMSEMLLTSAYFEDMKATHMLNNT